VLGFGRVDPRVIDVDLGMVATQFAHDVYDLGVAQVWAAFLEGETEDQDSRIDHLHLASRHELDDFVGHIAGHAVVDAAAGEDDFGVVADFLRLVREVIGINPDAVAADQAGTKGQEVPLAAGGFEDFESVYAEAMEYQREFIHQSDVEVALGVLNDLCRFGYLDGTGLVRAGGDDAAIQGIDKVGDFRSRAGGDLLDGGQAVLLVAGVDALGAVAGKEIAIEAQTGMFFQQGNANFFGGAGIDGGFVDDDGALGHDLANRFRCLDQGIEVRPLGIVDRGGHGDDEDAAIPQLFGVGGEAELIGIGQFGGFDFAGTVAAGLEFVDTALLDVEAADRKLLAEFDSQRQADIAETDDGDADGGVDQGLNQIRSGCCHGYGKDAVS